MSQHWQQQQRWQKSVHALAKRLMMNSPARHEDKGQKAEKSFFFLYGSPPEDTMYILSKSSHFKELDQGNVS